MIPTPNQRSIRACGGKEAAKLDEASAKARSLLQ